MTPMVDLVFAVRGSAVPSDYRYVLWSALRSSLPWVDQEPSAGIVAMRVTPTGGAMALLARRAKLTLRLPLGRVEAAGCLQGARIELGNEAIEIAAAHPKPLAPSATLYSHLVVLGPEDEAGFMRALQDELARLDLGCRFILGRRGGLRAGERRLVGYPVALHDCGAEESMCLQQIGLGQQRGLGCGIFVPHKRIDADG